MSKASKNNKGNVGIPDLLYVNESKKILIIMEIKPTIAEHISKDGIKHYMNFFLNKNLEKGRRNY